MTEATRAHENVVTVSWRRPDARHEALRSLASGDAKRAVSVLEQEIRTGRETGGHWYALELARMELGHSREAAESVERALRLDPGNAGIWLLAGRLSSAAAHAGDANARWRRAELLRPDWPDPPFLTAELNALATVHGIDDGPLTRAHHLAPLKWRQFPVDPGRPPIPGSLWKRIAGSLGGELLRRVLPRWTNDTSVALTTMRLSQLGFGREAIDLVRVLLVFRPQGRASWMTLSNLQRENQLDRWTGPSMLRAFMLGGFGIWSTRMLLFSLRRSFDNLDHVLPYFRDHAFRSEVNEAVHRALAKARLERDGAAVASDEALRRAASVSGPVADGRVLRQVAVSRKGDGPLVTLSDAVVIFDTSRVMLVHGDDHVVPDRDAVPDAPPTVHVRFEGEPLRHVEQAFLLGRSANHYDWLIETSRNLKAYVDEGLTIPFLTMGPAPTRGQLGLFDVLGLRDRALPWLSLDCMIQCGALTLTPDLFKPIGFETSHLRWLREVVLARVNAKPRRATPRRFFVSRRDSNRRRVANEEEIAHALGAKGFEVVTLGGLSLTDQAALFDGADVIVAGKGAGLANLAFCRPGTRIVELSPSRSPEVRHFEDISAALGLDYQACFGEAGSIEWASNNEISLRFDVSGIVDAVETSSR